MGLTLLSFDLPSVVPVSQDTRDLAVDHPDHNVAYADITMLVTGKFLGKFYG